MSTTAASLDDRSATEGAVVDGYFPAHLLRQLGRLAGSAPVSGRTGIVNHIANAFEAYDGETWPETYFDQVAEGRHQAVEQWARRARVLASQVIGIPIARQATNSEGKPFTTAVVRETVNGISWHFDDSHLEYQGSELDLGTGSQQYSVITYLNSPELGELEITDWRPESMGFHPKESYPLDEGNFADSRRLRVQPITGRTAVIRSQYAHRVHPSVGPRRFITMFIAVDNTSRTTLSFG